MRRLRIHFIWFLIFIISGCIEEYQPKDVDHFEAIVINGIITDQEGFQYVEVSRTAPYDDQENIPEENCTVEVKDEMGNNFTYEEYEAGKYRSYITQKYLKTGLYYQLFITTSEGKEYISEAEKIIPCPPIKNVYYETKEVETSDPYVTLWGLQFFIDVDGLGDTTNYFRWEIEETWEYFAQHMITHFYDTGNVGVYNYTDKIRNCWVTRPVKEVFTKSTNQVNSNKLRKVPIHYVSNETNRLKIKYSPLIKQYSLSEKSYNYWNELMLQGKETGGLYEGQPATIISNINCVDNPEEIVIGYFDASSVQKKRIFVDNSSLSFGVFDYSCQIDTVSVGDLFEMFGFNPPRPIYLHYVMVGDNMMYGYTFQPCFDCTLSIGDNQKPDFWE